MYHFTTKFQWYHCGMLDDCIQPMDCSTLFWKLMEYIFPKHQLPNYLAVFLFFSLKYMNRTKEIDSYLFGSGALWHLFIKPLRRIRTETDFGSLLIQSCQYYKPFIFSSVYRLQRSLEDILWTWLENSYLPLWGKSDFTWEFAS